MHQRAPRAHLTTGAALAAALLGASASLATPPSPDPDVLVRWEFSSGLDGWGGGDAGTAAADGLGGEVWWRGGMLVLRGHATSLGGGPLLWVDSPPLAAPVDADAHVVLRARHLSACASGGAVVARNGSAPPGDPSWPRHEGLADSRWRAGFPVVADGGWHVYAVPLLPPAAAGEPDATSLVLGRLRLLPCLDDTGGVSAEVDWVRLARSPTLTGVTGCGAVLSGGVPPSDTIDDAAASHPAYRPWVRSRPPATDAHHASAADAADPVGSRRAPAGPSNASLPYAATYNCALGGGDVITLRGAHLGPAHSPPVVTIGGARCANVAWLAPQTAVTCVVPPGALPPAVNGTGLPVNVTVANGAMPLLAACAPLLTYAAPPGPPPAPPALSNVAATGVDVSWRPPPDAWQAMAVSGYLLQWRAAVADACDHDEAPLGAACVLVRGGGDDTAYHRVLPNGTTSAAPAVVWAAWPAVGDALAAEAAASMAAPASAGGAPAAAGWVVTGNVTATPLWGLPPDTRLQVRVAALVEPTFHAPPVWVAALDAATGQRPTLPGALVGAFSPPSDGAVATLPADVLFSRFTAGAAADGGPAYPASTPTAAGGWAGGEGAYGLVLVGSAAPGNCNATAACCDGFGGPGFADAIAGLARASGEAPPLARYVQSPAPSWIDVGGYPTEIPAVWGAGALRALRDRMAQAGSWRSFTSSPQHRQQQEWPWFGYDDAADLAFTPAHALAAAQAAWLADAAASALPPNATVAGSYAWNGSAFVNASTTVPAAAAAAATTVDVARVTGATPSGTTYAYYAPVPRPALPPALYDAHGRRLVGVTGGHPAAACGTSCAGVRRVARPPPLTDPPYREVGDAAAATPLPRTVHGGIDMSAPVTGRAPPSLTHAAATAAALSAAAAAASAPNATAPCGPALRLTGSHPHQTGAAWYARPQAVRAGFDASFVARLANPSTACRTNDGAFTRCASRGGGGLAFVVQNWHPAALGGGGTAGLGYAGIPLSVAVVLDTWADGGSGGDVHDNTVSVRVAAPDTWCDDGSDGSDGSGGNSSSATRPRLRRVRRPTSPATASAGGVPEPVTLGSAPFRGLPDLTRGLHAVRVVYDPAFNPALAGHPAFAPASSPSAAAFWAAPRPCREYPHGDVLEEAGDGSDGGAPWLQPPPTWRAHGTGTLSVYVDDVADAGNGSGPVLIVPLDLDGALRLGDTHGRAWAGFTAATGEAVWQTHDVLAWAMTSTRAGGGGRASG